MRASLAAVVAILATATPVVAATLTPNEIQATFFTGQPFTASATNVKYKMVFSADGKMTREPAGTAGSKSEGTWKLSKDGFCTTWKNSPQNCFTLVSAGENKWSVMKGPVVMATWSK